MCRVKVWEVKEAYFMANVIPSSACWLVVQGHKTGLEKAITVEPNHVLSFEGPGWLPQTCGDSNRKLVLNQDTWCLSWLSLAWRWPRSRVSMGEVFGLVFPNPDFRWPNFSVGLEEWSRVDVINKPWESRESQPIVKFKDPIRST